MICSSEYRYPADVCGIRVEGWRWRLQALKNFTAYLPKYMVSCVNLQPDTNRQLWAMLLLRQFVFWYIQDVKNMYFLRSHCFIEDSYCQWIFNFLLTVHHAMILGNCPTWRTNSFQCIYLFYSSLHVSSMSCSSSGETNCINAASGNCHSVLVAVSCAGWE